MVSSSTHSNVQSNKRNVHKSAIATLFDVSGFSLVLMTLALLAATAESAKISGVRSPAAKIPEQDQEPSMTEIMAAASDLDLLRGQQAKRSVNFTPSWGKRSGYSASRNFAELAEAPRVFPSWGDLTASDAEVVEGFSEGQGQIHSVQQCLIREVYIESLMKKLKVRTR